MGEAASPWIALAATAAPTFVGRAAGARLGGRLSTASPVFRWMECVSYALLAGLVARMLLLPAGPLAAVALPVRLAATMVAAAAFLASGRRILVGAGAGVATLALLSLVQ
jgi:branched-subunit amino acid transport protein